MSETSTEKLALYPEKLMSLVSEGLDLTYPISVPISLTRGCNQHCVWCSDLLIRDRFPDRLNQVILLNLFNDLAGGGTQGIVLEGGGEPTLSPYFNLAVEDAVKAGLKVGLITNGTQDLPTNILRRLSWIRVSLDASSEDEYAKFKGHYGDYQQVLAHIESFARHCPLVGVGYLVCQGNHQHLADLLPRFADAGVDHVHFHPVQDHPELTDPVWTPPESPVKIYSNAMSEHSLDHDGQLGCLANSITCDIVQSGGVFICNELDQAYSWWPPMGDLCRQSFQSIWNGAQRALQSSLVRDPQWCQKHCPRCRITKYSQMVDRLRRIKTRGFI